MERRQADQGLKGPRNDMVVSSLGFLLTSYIPALELNKLATQKHHRTQTKQLQQKPALSSQRTSKREA